MFRNSINWNLGNKDVFKNLYKFEIKLMFNVSSIFNYENKVINNVNF